MYTIGIRCINAPKVFADNPLCPRTFSGPKIPITFTFVAQPYPSWLKKKVLDGQTPFDICGVFNWRLNRSLSFCDFLYRKEYE